MRSVRWTRYALPWFLILLLFPAPALPAGGDLIWFFQGVEDVYGIDDIEDVDGDSIPDVIVESYDAGAVGDHLYCLSGASSIVADVIWSTKPAGGLSSGGGYGDECLVVGPDYDGDGHEDVLLGTAWGGGAPMFSAATTEASTITSTRTSIGRRTSPNRDGSTRSSRSRT